MKGGRTKMVCFIAKGAACNTPESNAANITMVGKMAVIQEKSKSECGEDP
jgi:hypothetical protein